MVSNMMYTTSPGSDLGPSRRVGFGTPGDQVCMGLLPAYVMGARQNVAI